MNENELKVNFIGHALIKYGTLDSLVGPRLSCIVIFREEPLMNNCQMKDGRRPSKVALRGDSVIILPTASASDRNYWIDYDLAFAGTMIFCMYNEKDDLLNCEKRMVHHRN